jgi:hypothetical protein
MMVAPISRYGWIILLLWILAAVAVKAVAAETDRCRLQVDTILASSDDDRIDAKVKRHLGSLRGVLNFSAYRLIGSQSRLLTIGASETLTLPGDRRMMATLHTVEGDIAEITLAMVKADRTLLETRIQLFERGQVFVGGPAFLNGNLIFRLSGSHYE